MQHPTDRIVHTTAFVIPIIEHWNMKSLSGFTMRGQSNDPLHHEQT